MAIAMSRYHRAVSVAMNLVLQRDGRRRREIKKFDGSRNIFFSWSTTGRATRGQKPARIPDAPLGTGDTPKRVVQILISRPSRGTRLTHRHRDSASFGSGLRTLPCPPLRTGWAGWQFYYDVVAYFPVNHHFFARARAAARRDAFYNAIFFSVPSTPRRRI